jgi:hypothetical protein
MCSVECGRSTYSTYLVHEYLAFSIADNANYISSMQGRAGQCSVV